MTKFEQLLAQAAQFAGTELLVMAGDVPAVRVSENYWVRLRQIRFSPADVATIVQSIMPPDAWEHLDIHREFDFDYTSPTAGPLACNVHFQRGTLVLLARFQLQPALAH